MIFFFSTFDIILLFFIFITLLIGAVNILIKIITFLFILFIVKNILQDFIIGFFFNHNNFLLTIYYFVIDTTRVSLFFYTLKQYSLAYSQAGGLAVFSEMFDFIIVILLGGGLYLLGEISSLLHSSNKNELSDYPKFYYFIGDFLLLAILALFCWFVKK